VLIVVNLVLNNGTHQSYLFVVAVTVIVYNQHNDLNYVLPM